MRLARQVLVGAAVISAIAVGDVGTAQAQDGGRARLTTAVLTGANEVPGPGDRDGVGAAAVVVNPRTDQVCYLRAVRRIEPATMAHIHRGPTGVACPIVVHLNPPTNGFSAACADAEDIVEAGVVDEIAANPQDFYVNVHNAPFEAGAIRGQLH